MLHLVSLLGVMAISFAAILVRLADVSSTTATFYRCVYATPILLLIWWARRAADLRTRRSHVVGLLAGVVLFLDLSLWHEAVLRIGAGLGTVLANIQVVFVGLVGWLLHGERPSRLAFVTTPCILVGVVLVSGLGRSDAHGHDPVGGVIFGVLAGAAYAGYLLTLRAANPDAGPPAGPLSEATIGAVVATALLGPVVDPGFAWRIPIEAHAWLLVLGLVAQVCGWLLIGTSLPRLPALETSVMLLVQPIVTMLWGALLLGEGTSPVQLGGVALVLAGVGLLTALGSVRPARSGHP